MMMGCDFVDKAQVVAQMLKGVVKRTPLTYSRHLSSMTGNAVYLKQENLQHSGSCKARSAGYMLSTLSPEQKSRGVVTVSTGNNGISMTMAMRQHGINGVVFVPDTIAPHKARRIRDSGAKLVFVGHDIVESEFEARGYAAHTNRPFLSPYNDWGAIFGQGTIALEIVEQLTAFGKGLDCIFVPVGGGGLISGVGGYLKAVDPAIKVIGVQPLNSPVMVRSLEAGEELHTTLRPEINSVVAELRQRNLSLAIISGDQEQPTRALARELGIDTYFANTLPENKAALIEKLQHEGRVVCFIGDGINDAIALKQADVSISLRGATTIATDTAQIVLMDQGLKRVSSLFDLAEEFDKTIRAGIVATFTPGVICIGGVFLLGFGIYAAEILFQLGLFCGLAVAMKPLLGHGSKQRGMTSPLPIAPSQT